MSKLKLQALLKPFSDPRLIGFIAVIVFALIGSLYLLLSSHAATPTASLEAETGSISSLASQVSDSTTSGSSAVKFGTGSSGSTTCPLPKYPMPSCTGLPADTAFTNTINGDYTITTNGQTIDKWHITGDVHIAAQNVIIKNSQIDGHIENEGPSPPPAAYINSSFSVTDTTIGTSTCSTDGQPSINGHDFTATRDLLQGHADGIDVVGSNIIVNDSYIHPCFLPASIVGGDGYHTDGLQDQCDHAIATICANIRLTHNTFDSSAQNSNSALNIGSRADGEDVADVTAQNNLFIGGTYTTGFDWDNVGDKARWIVTSNVWSNNSWAYGPVDTATDGINATCSNQTWSGNQIVTIDSNFNVTSVVKAQPCE